MITFKDIEKEYKNTLSNNTLDEKERKKNLIKHSIIGGVALVSGILVYKYIFKKGKNNSKLAEF